MVNWQSPAEVVKDGAAFSKFMHVLLGLYIWEWFTSLRFDWDYLSGKRQFRWPMIFYFLNRYCLLFALIGISIALNVTSEVDCQALYTFNSCLGNASIGLASINLSLRTIAVWSQRWVVVVPLVAVIMGHWSLLLHGILLKAEWTPDAGCVITATDNKILAATFIYTMAFDFTVLSLTAWKLVINVPSAASMGGRSKLSSLIFGDGLIYFIIAFCSNLLATIFMLLNLNPVMSIIANVPAAISSTIVACRAVRRLSKYTHKGAEVFNSTQASTLAFRTNTSQGPKRAPSAKGLGRFGLASTPNSGSGLANLGLSKLEMQDGVHVQMETFESPTSDFASKTEEYSPMDMPRYDAMGNPIRPVADEYEDPESQRIKSDFKRPPY
ncbi:hypothetical protein C8J56DRAFT_916601 [Mycena floridula]|nr:hypothetical protein C8J56DRAFT_916601 [Mycena floridula]